MTLQTQSIFGVSNTNLPQAGKVVVCSVSSMRGDGGRGRPESSQPRRVTSVHARERWGGTYHNVHRNVSNHSAVRPARSLCFTDHRLNGLFGDEQPLKLFCVTSDIQRVLFFAVLSVSPSLRRVTVSERCHFSSNIAFSYPYLLDMDCEIW